MLVICVLLSACSNLPNRTSLHELSLQQINRNNELDGKYYAFCDPKGGAEKCDQVTPKTAINNQNVNSHSNINDAVKNQVNKIRSKEPLARVLFDFNRSQLNAASVKQLNALLPTLREKKIQLIGYTDNIGGKFYNTHLALKRAQSIKVFLIKTGFSSDQIITEGHGLCCYVVPNDTAWQRGRNRRVDIIAIHSVE